MSLGEEGQVTVLFALAIVVLVGFSALTVDGGRLYLQRTRVQNAADAAALAGARELPEYPATAEEVARDYLIRNGIDGSQASINVDPASISVQVADEIQWTLARVFGSDTGSFSARAGAEVGVAGAVRGVVPMGIEEGNYELGDPVTLKLGQAGKGCEGGGSYHGNFHAIAFPGDRGANNYRYYLERGYPNFVGITEQNQFETEPGLMKGPTIRGLRARLDQDLGSTYEDFAPGSPRLVYAPVVTTFDLNGRKMVNVVGFAAVFLEDVDNCGNVRGRFIRYYGDAEFREYLNEEDFGLRVVRLNQ